MERGLGLLHRAHGAEDVLVGFFGSIRLRFVVLALKGYIIAVAAQQNQEIALQGHGIDDLLQEFLPDFLIFQPAGAQIHQELMLGASRHLSGLEGDINQVSAQGSREHLAQQSKILVRLIFRHDPGALAKLGNNLPVFIHIAAEHRRHIAPVPALSAANLADFLLVHGHFLSNQNVGYRLYPVSR